MNRGIITISENGTVSMPTDTVWMTMQEPEAFISAPVQPLFSSIDPGEW